MHKVFHAHAIFLGHTTRTHTHTQIVLGKNNLTCGDGTC